MARSHHTWFGLVAVAVVLASCGSDNNDVARVHGVAGGDEASGTGGGATGGSSSDSGGSEPVAGSGAGGAAGSGGASGASGGLTGGSGGSTGGSGGLTGGSGGSSGASGGLTGGSSSTGGDAGQGGGGGSTGGSAGQGGTGGTAGTPGGSAGAGGAAGGCSTNGEQDPTCVQFGYPPISYFCPMDVGGPPAADCVLSNAIDSGDFYCCPGGFGGAGGSGGTGALDPPAPGIACGEVTCDEDTEACCVDASALACGADYCAATVRLTCDDSADCPGERCCMTTISASARISTFCSVGCGTASEQTQVCKQDADCDNGAACHPVVCHAGDTNHIPLGLCSETVFAPCE